MFLSGIVGFWVVERPSSATALGAAVERTVRSRTPAMLERTVERPFAAAVFGVAVIANGRFISV